MLKLTYFGHTTFVLESKDITLLLNPGIWNGEPVVPEDIDVRIIVATNRDDDSVGNAAEIAANAKAWFLGNEETVEKVRSQGGKSWLLHTLKVEETYETPGLKIGAFTLQKKDPKSGERYENLGLYIEMGGMKVGYLGDSAVQGPFGEFEMDVLIVPIGGGEAFEVKDAVSLCLDAKPRIGIPVRWTSPDQPSNFAKYVSQFGQGVIPVVMEHDQVLEIHWAAGNEFRHTLS